jgi:hypothetical protein
MGQTPDELREELADRRAAVSQDLEAIGDRVSPGRMVERRRAQVGSYARRARDAVMGAADSVEQAAGSVGSTAASVGSSAAEVPGAVLTRTQGAPLAAGLAAFGIGFVVASIAPASRVEERAAAKLEPALQSAAGEVGAAAMAVGDQVRDEARAAAVDLRESAEESAQRVAGSADAPADDGVQYGTF